MSSIMHIALSISSVFLIAMLPFTVSLRCKHTMNTTRLMPSAKSLMYDQGNDRNVLMDKTEIRSDCEACLFLEKLTSVAILPEVTTEIVLPTYFCLTGVEAAQCSNTSLLKSGFALNDSYQLSCCTTDLCNENLFAEMWLRNTTVTTEQIDNGLLCYIGNDDTFLIQRCDKDEQCLKVGVNGTNIISCSQSLESMSLGLMIGQSETASSNLCSETSRAIALLGGLSISCCNSDLCNALDHMKGESPIEDFYRTIFGAKMETTLKPSDMSMTMPVSRNVVCYHTDSSTINEGTRLLYDKSRNLNIFDLAKETKNNCEACSAFARMQTTSNNDNIMTVMYRCLNKSEALACGTVQSYIGSDCAISCCRTNHCANEQFANSHICPRSDGSSASTSGLSNNGPLCYVGSGANIRIQRCGQDEQCSIVDLENMLGAGMGSIVVCSRQWSSGSQPFIENVDPSGDLCSESVQRIARIVGTKITCCNSDLCNAIGHMIGKTPIADFERSGFANQVKATEKPLTTRSTKCLQNIRADDEVAAFQQGTLLYDRTEQLNIIVRRSETKDNCAACTAFELTKQVRLLSGAVNVKVVHFMCLETEEVCSRASNRFADDRICKPSCCKSDYCNSYSFATKNQCQDNIDQPTTLQPLADGIYCYVGNSSVQLVKRCNKGEHCSITTSEFGDSVMEMLDCSQQTISGHLLKLQNIDDNGNVCSNKSQSYLRGIGTNVTCCDSDLCNEFGHLRGRSPFADFEHFKTKVEIVESTEQTSDANDLSARVFFTMTIVLAVLFDLRLHF